VQELVNVVTAHVDAQYKHEEKWVPVNDPFIYTYVCLLKNTRWQKTRQTTSLSESPKRHH